MKNKKAFIRILRIFLSALTLMTGPILYFYLVKKGVGDAVMYSANSPVFVIALSILAALGVWLILKKPLFEEEAESEDFEYCEEETEAETPAPDIEETEKARELYPELFRDAPEPEVREAEVKISSAYFDALTNAINSQKAQFVPESRGEEKDETEDILEIKESEREISDILADLPETLPEGYVPYSEEEPEEEDEEETNVERPKASTPLRILKREAAAVVIIALSLSFSLISASAYTVYSGEGFSVHTAFSEKSYKWEDCEKYEIAPSFFGDRIDVTLYMKDGQKIGLLPSDAVFTEAFYGKYDSVYQYALHAANAMTDAGAEKHVKERNTIESNFCSREDIGEYIRNLID